MAGISVNVNKGSLNKAIQAIRLFTTAKDDAIRREVGANAHKIAADAKGFCPVDTGLLRSSIKADISPNGLSATVGTDTFYAGFIEFGTTRQRAQPFLYPAFNANRQSFVANLKRILSSK